MAAARRHSIALQALQVYGQGVPVKGRQSVPKRLAQQAQYIYIYDIFVRGVLLIFLIFLARSDSKVSELLGLE